ncbi:hypothetical protein BSZ35_00060 [Salinibacter sp. 10B]|nr:hypothetical protein BSZ35_00060 [Salinibacter sp. 10B]
MTDLENEHHLVSFRNQYGHGATPPPEECLNDVGEYLPVLKELVHTPLFTKIGLAARGKYGDAQLFVGGDRQSIKADVPEGHAAALLPDESERDMIDLWPLGVTAEAEADSGGAVSAGELRFFFFDALKNRAVYQLNYEGPVHRRDEDLYDPFLNRLPLRAWREEVSTELESFTHEMAVLTEAFKGRHEVRAHLRGFAAGGEGTLMVFGAPGIGKSALLAQVVREIEAGIDADGQILTGENGTPIDPPPVIEFFIRWSEGKNDPVRFLRYLCRHLDERYGLDGHGIGSEPVELQEQLSARLEAIEGKTGEDNPKRTLLLVDGLDEAPELGRYIPESRSWLPVIISSRETPEAKEFYEGRRRETRSKMTVGPLGKREVRAILYEGANKYDPAFDEDYVEAVAERSEGNPLYLTLLVEELVQGKIEVGDIDALPEKIGKLYEEAVRRVTKDGENQTVLGLLHLLAETKTPLTEEAIADYLEVNPMQASSAVREAMELLHEASPEALYPAEDTPEDAFSRKAVQLFHESLREWLREKHEGTCEKMQERLAEKTAKWGERKNETARRYALRYGAVHQRDAGRHADLYDLLAGDRFQEKQVQTFKQYEATFASYEVGLEAYVGRNGKTPDDDARLCRLALDAGRVAREAKERVTQAFRWAEKGRMEVALQRIEVLGEEKYFLAALQLIWIEVNRQADWPEEERSSEKVQQVLDAVDEQVAPGTNAVDWDKFFNKELIIWWADQVAAVFPSVDLTSLLLRTSDSKGLTEALLSRIKSRGSTPYLTVQAKEVRRVAQTIESNTKFVAALSSLGSFLIETGQREQATATFDRALDVACSIDHRRTRVEVLSDLASVLAEEGQHAQATDTFDQALDTALSIDDDSVFNERAQALSNLTSALAETGSFDRALYTARSIGDGYHRAEVLTDLASALTEAGHIEQARATFSRALDVSSSIDSNRRRAEALSDLTAALAEAGTVEQTLPLFKQILDETRAIDSEYNRYEALSGVASALAEASAIEQTLPLFEQALDEVRAIDYEPYRAKALSGVASALIEAGAIEQTLPLFERVLDAFQEINDDWRCADALFDLASVLTETRDIKCAKTISTRVRTAAELIDDDRRHAEVLLSFASVFTNHGETEEALATLEQVLYTTQDIDSNLRRAEVFSSVHSLLTDLGETESARSIFEQAFGAALEIDNENGRTKVSFDDHVRIFSDNRGRAFTSIDSVIANDGDFEQALETVQAIDDEGDRAWALSGLAALVADFGESKRARAIFERAFDTARAVDHDPSRTELLLGLSSTISRSGGVDFAIDVAVSIADLSKRVAAIREIAEQQAEAGQADSFAQHMPQIELPHDGWTDFLTTWRETLLEHTDEPRPLLRQSLTQHPFDVKAAAEGVYSLVQAHVQAGAIDYAEAIAKECPELELNVLISEESEREPDDLAPERQEQYDQLANLRDQGLLREEEFEEKVQALFEQDKE